MKSRSLTLTISLLLIVFFTLVMSEAFYLIVVAYIATFFIGLILRSGQFSKKTNDIGWGMLYGALILLSLLAIFFIWLGNLDGVPF